MPSNSGSLVLAPGTPLATEVGIRIIRVAHDAAGRKVLDADDSDFAPHTVQDAGAPQPFLHFGFPLASGADVRDTLSCAAVHIRRAQPGACRTRALRLPYAGFPGACQGRVRQAVCLITGLGL